MKSGKGLGKGLGAIFEAQEQEEQVKGIRLRDVEPNPEQPRREFDPQALAELEDSIRQNGVITPITVRKTGDTYQIIAGERRWRAARAAGLTEIPAYVLDIDKEEAYQLALIENLQRQDLNPIEEALGFKKLMEDYGLSQEKAGERVGRSRPYIANSLRLLNLPEGIKEMVASGALSAGHGRTLAGADGKIASQAAGLIIEKELSVRETEKLVKRMTEEAERGERPEKKESSMALYISSLEQELSAQTNHTVKIDHGRKKGKLTIEYYGNEDLELICDAIKQIKKAK